MFAGSDAGGRSAHAPAQQGGIGFRLGRQPYLTENCCGEMPPVRRCVTGSKLRYWRDGGDHRRVRRRIMDDVHNKEMVRARHPPLLPNPVVDLLRR
jgi:hypothetical protein